MHPAPTNHTKHEQSMRPFLAIWTGQVFSLLGSELVQFALVWWLTITTGSATVLAVATMMAILPRVFVGPFAGALVDRWNRRQVMIAADTISALVIVVLVVMFAMDAVEIWHVYAVMFIRATSSAFHWPAMQASTTLMVPEEHLARVAGLNQALQGFGAIAGPPMGAFLISILPMHSVLATDVITAILAIVPLFFVPVPQPDSPLEHVEKQGPSIGYDLREAVRFLRGWPGILMVMGIAILVNLLIYPALALQPLLVTAHFGGGVTQLAILQSAFGIGMVAGGLTLSVWGGFKSRTLTGLLALALSGVGFVGLGLAPTHGFLFGVCALFWAWFMNPIANGSLFAVLQIVVPAEMQGRVFTLLQSMAGMMVPLGLAAAAPISEWLGIRTWFVIAGIAIVILGLTGLLIPAITDLDKLVDDPIEKRHGGLDTIEESRTIPSHAT